MNVLQNVLSAVSPQPDGDFVDKLNYCVSTIALVVCSAFITGWSFVGNPINCWFPAYYKGWWCEYALDYCFIQNTYFVPFIGEAKEKAFEWDSVMAPSKNVTELPQTKQIGYYQWVPFILALQALLFYTPVVIWRLLYGMCGQNLTALCNTCTANEGNEESRKGTMVTMAGFISQKRRRNLHINTKYQSIADKSAVFMSYLFMKVLFLLNVLFQFALLKKMLAVDSHFWGFEVLADLYNGHDWPETGNFPRVTMCDYSVRVLDSFHKHTVQCVLMINMFNEKIFVGLWFWLFGLSVLTMINFVNWIVKSVGTNAVKEYVKPYIHDIDAKAKTNRGKLQQFVTEHLTPDAVFTLRLIEINNGKAPVRELLHEMWSKFNAAHPPPYSAPMLVKDAEPLLKNYDDETQI
ncbi:unnamed protein product [Caenorhabditis bovis]|uniref:Innexin n=1 Tax=Caenorhabditis bovis TaxID=2654633 RepID=A0A8S1F0Y6_9PELO|nr:unnamed protein product [Caenorhabditis bovis]